MNKPLIIICGPTGVGKSEVSLALARQFGAEIVSADSQQVYKGMDLGTAKLASSLRSQVKHYLIDEVSPCDPFDAAIFVQHADKAIADIQARNKLAFIVGGTGLYIKALLFGLCAAPARDEVFRQQLTIEMQSLGSAYFHQQLAKKDPEAVLSIHPNDTSRIVRALEICHVTQKTASEFYQAHKFGECKYPFLLEPITDDDEYELCNEYHIIQRSRIIEMIRYMCIKIVHDEKKARLKREHDDNEYALALSYSL